MSHDVMFNLFTADWCSLVVVSNRRMYIFVFLLIILQLLAEVCMKGYLTA